MNSNKIPNFFSIESYVYLGDRGHIDEPEILQKYNLAINTKFSFLSCIHPKCGHILTGNWKIHLRDSHRLFPSNIECTNISQLLPPEDDQPFGEEPVQGLRIMKGFECDYCPFVSESKRILKTHQRNEHPNNMPLSHQVWIQEQSYRYLRFKVSFPLPYLISIFSNLSQKVTLPEAVPLQNVPTLLEIQNAWAAPPIADAQPNQNDLSPFWRVTGFHRFKEEAGEAFWDAINGMTPEDELMQTTIEEYIKSIVQNIEEHQYQRFSSFSSQFS